MSEDNEMVSKVLNFFGNTDKRKFKRFEVLNLSKLFYELYHARVECKFLTKGINDMLEV